MSEKEDWVWCDKCGRMVRALISGSGKRWIGIECKHRSQQVKSASKVK